MLYSRALSIAVAAGVLLAAGCAATPYQELVPPMKGDRPTRLGKSLSVGPVTSSSESRAGGVVANVTAETFREALIETLRRSQLFETVATAPDGSYRLSAEIISEKYSGMLANTITLFVRYELERDGTPIWSENILSEDHMTPEQVFVGAERHLKLQTNVFRANLAELLEKLPAAIGRK